MTITGAAVEGSIVEGGAEEKGDANDATTEDGIMKKAKKKRAVRATLYTYRNAEGAMYHIPINSTLGDEYRTLTSREERVKFMAKNGTAKPGTDTRNKGISLCARGVA